MGDGPHPQVPSQDDNFAVLQPLGPPPIAISSHVNSIQYADPRFQHAFASQLGMTQDASVPGSQEPYHMGHQMGHMVNSHPQAFPPFLGQNLIAQTRQQPRYGPSSTMAQVSHHGPHGGTQPFFASQHPHQQQHSNLPHPRPHTYSHSHPHSHLHSQPQPQQPHYNTGQYTQPPLHALSPTVVPHYYAPPGYYHKPQSLPGYFRGFIPQEITPLTYSANSAESGVVTVDHGSSSRTPTDATRGPQSPSAVRGPPRKPKQSGHAIWIGNLPPQTDLMKLVHHVCDGCPGLESLFLIAKSNCAFANFRDEQACLAAQQKLHDTRFQAVRLVSRLRKNTIEGTSGILAPTGPASTTSDGCNMPDAAMAHLSLGGEPNSSAMPRPDGPSTALAGERTSQRDRFFVLKSLTVEDLEISVKTGIWATQKHNEETLNHAFKSVKNVFLIFSANKSGEYFGYGRMASSVNKNPDAAIRLAPKVQSVAELDLPKAIQTEAIGSVPRGRIVDDSPRGTIFWEVERAEKPPPGPVEGVDGASDDRQASSTAGPETGVGTGGTSGAAGGASSSGATNDQGGKDESNGNDAGAGEAEAEAEADAGRTWGKPFKLDWVSTERLPFYRTRGIRNPWNANREVKIARDGTELEPSVGRRLIVLFGEMRGSAGELRSPMRSGTVSAMGQGQGQGQDPRVGLPY